MVCEYELEKTCVYVQLTVVEVKVRDAFGDVKRSPVEDGLHVVVDEVLSRPMMH